MPIMPAARCTGSQSGRITRCQGSTGQKMHSMHRENAYVESTSAQAEQRKKQNVVEYFDAQSLTGCEGGEFSGTKTHQTSSPHRHSSNPLALFPLPPSQEFGSDLA